MLYIINGDTVKPFRGKKITYTEDGITYTTTNPSEALLRSMGYKELVKANIPNYNPQMEYLVAKYTDNGEKIIESYIVKGK